MKRRKVNMPLLTCEGLPIVSTSGSRICVAVIGHMHPLHDTMCVLFSSQALLPVRVGSKVSPCLYDFTPN